MTNPAKKRVDIANGTEGRVYGGNPNLIHVEDGKRVMVGEFIANTINIRMREAAYARKARTALESYTQPLCPGCYMIVGFNALVTLAKQNGQPLRELARTMKAAFEALENEDDYEKAFSEEIVCLIDID